MNDDQTANGLVGEMHAGEPVTAATGDDQLMTLMSDVQKQLATITYWYWRRRDLALNPGADVLRTAALETYRLAVELNARAEHIDPTSPKGTT